MKIGTAERSLFQLLVKRILNICSGFARHDCKIRGLSIITPSLFTGAGGETHSRFERAIRLSVKTAKRLGSQEPSVWVCVATDDKRDGEQVAF